MHHQIWTDEIKTCLSDDILGLFHPLEVVAGGGLGRVVAQGVRHDSELVTNSPSLFPSLKVS